MSNNFIRIDNYLANKHSSLIYGSMDLEETDDSESEEIVKHEKRSYSPYSYRIEGENNARNIKVQKIFKPAYFNIIKHKIKNSQILRISKYYSLFSKISSIIPKNFKALFTTRTNYTRVSITPHSIWIIISMFTGLLLSNVWMIQSTKSIIYPSATDIKLHTFTKTDLILNADESSADNDKITENIFNEVEIQKYTLQPGDFLLNLAKDFNISIDTLVSWNNIRDARRIRAGDELIVPNRSGLLHTVKRGESIDGLASTYNIKTVSILDANNLPTNVIAPGTKLFLPEAKMDKFQLDLVLGNVFLAPTRGYISSGYGYRISPITGVRMFHAAVDIANKVGTPILAATYGTVSYTMLNNPTYGKMVVITHPGGFRTLYAHLDKIFVRNGERVARGEQIATMGNTGLSTGPHLHFAVIHNGRSLNPLIYVRVRH